MQGIRRVFLPRLPALSERCLSPCFRTSSQRPVLQVQGMPTSRASLSHVDRTAQEPRENDINHVVLDKIEQVNPSVRLLQLAILNGKAIKFMPGQWLDVYIPRLPNPGGFTITSTPADAKSSPGKNGYLELAIQKSPRNPPAAWLWQPEADILGKGLLVRVGGSFVWPPPGINLGDVKKVVFIAGGVGINPLISMLTHITNLVYPLPFINFLYTTRSPLPSPLSSILFLPRLRQIFNALPSNTFSSLSLYLTPPPTSSSTNNNLAPLSTKDTPDPSSIKSNLSIYDRHISHTDLLSALGPAKDRVGVVAYVCGPSGMTDEFVEVLQHAEGMVEKRVLCEKWW